MGTTTRSVGNATTQDVAQAPSHAENTPGATPMLRNVDTPETMQDMTTDVARRETKLL
jgi:hypothetical protein